MLTKLIILLNSIRKFYLTFPKKKLKSPKVPESFEKRIFKEKLINQKRRNLFEQERETESSNFWICITSFTPIENVSKYKRKVANIFMLLWLPTI